jgi:hypothetical protein
VVIALTLAFWGSQGRIGIAQSGPWTGRYVFVYPDTLEQWWTFVVAPSPNPNSPGENYVSSNDEIIELLMEWGVEWIPLGEGETQIERKYFGWRPLAGPVEWLQ